MPPDNDDQAARNIEELRQLFMASGRRRGRRFDEVMKAVRSRATEVFEDAAAEAVQDTEVAGRPARTAATSKPAATPTPDPRPVSAGDPEHDDAPAVAGAAAPDDQDQLPAPTDQPTSNDQSASPATEADEAVVAADAPSRPPPEALEVVADDQRQPGNDEAGRMLEGDRESGKPQKQPDPSSEQTRRRPARFAMLTLIAVVATFAAGLWLGRALNDSTTAVAPPSPPGITVSPSPATAASATAPDACLATAQYGDQVIAMLAANTRDERIDDVLKAYTLASQQCRAATAP
jgi:hypothetical protein